MADNNTSVTTLLANSQESKRMERLYSDVETIVENIESNSAEKTLSRVVNKLDIIIGGQKLYYKHRVDWDKTYGMMMIEYLDLIETNTRSLTSNDSEKTINLLKSLYDVNVNSYKLSKFQFDEYQRNGGVKSITDSTSGKDADKKDDKEGLFSKIGSILSIDKLKNAKFLAPLFSFANKFSSIIGIFSKIGPLILKAGTIGATIGVIMGVMDGISNVIEKTSQIGSYFGKTSDQLTFWESSIGGVSLFIEGFVEKITGMLSTLTGGFIGKVDIDPKKLSQDIVDFKDKIGEFITNIGTAIGDFFSDIPKYISKSFDFIKEKISELGGGTFGRFFKNINPFDFETTNESTQRVESVTGSVQSRLEESIRKRREMLKQKQVEPSVIEPASKLADVVKPKPQKRFIVPRITDENFPLFVSRKEGQKARSIYKTGDNSFSMLKENETNKIKAQSQGQNVIINNTNNTNSGSKNTIKSTTVMDSDLLIQTLQV